MEPTDQQIVQQRIDAGEPISEGSYQLHGAVRITAGRVVDFTEAKFALE